MLRNYISRHREYDEISELQFFSKPNCGFAFPCDSQGNIYWEQMSCDARTNYEYAIAHPEKFPFAYNEVYTWENSYTEPAQGDCLCGEHIYLYDEYLGACSCPNCGQWYNLFGQELNDPATWANGDDW